METTTATRSTVTLFDRANSQLKTLFLIIVITISHAFSPAVNRSRSATLLKTPSWRDLQVWRRHDQIFPWLECLITTLYIPFEKSQVMWFMSTENRIVNILKKNWRFFSAVLKPILKFLYQNGKHGCIFFSVLRTVLNQCIKIQTTICCHLGPPRALVWAQTALVGHWCCYWAMGACLGPGHASWRGRAAAMMVWGGGWPQDGLCWAPCGLWATGWTCLP